VHGTPNIDVVHIYFLENTRVIYKTVSSVIVVQFITSITALCNATFRACAYESSDIVVRRCTVSSNMYRLMKSLPVYKALLRAVLRYPIMLFLNIKSIVPRSFIRMIKVLVFKEIITSQCSCP